MDTVPRRLVDLSVAFARRYNRMTIDVRCEKLDGPVLFVANHGFGGVIDLNVVAFAAAYKKIGDDRDVVSLTHEIAWKLGVGRLVEMFDGRKAGHDSAMNAFSDGAHVLVFPGGDVDALKAWPDRNKVLFSGRTGFARLAMEAGVPIVPVVTAGAGESLYVLDSGERIARKTGLSKLLRLKTFPITISIPWGVNVGVVGLLPYLPLPTKLVTTVLPQMRPTDDETAEHYADRVRTTMQNELDALTERRTPLIG